MQVCLQHCIYLLLFESIYSVASMLAADSKMVNLNALGINRKAGNQYWLIAIGLQNQISDYIVIP